MDIGAVEFSSSSLNDPDVVTESFAAEPDGPFTASVTSAGGTPTGTVQFLDGGTQISGCTSVALASGQATCQTSSLALGDHTITADYSGDGNFNPSNGSLNGNPQAVTKITPTFGLTSGIPRRSLSRLPLQQRSRQVRARRQHLQFLDGANPIGGCNSVNLSSGQAVCQTSALSVTSHTIKAEYSGDATFSSSSANLNGNPQVVNQANVTASVTSSLNPSVRGDQ